MKVRAAAATVALQVWALASAQTVLSPPAPLPAPAPYASAPEQADIWGHLTAEQRRELWQRLTPEERASVWRRLTPTQRQAIRNRLPPDQRQAIPERWAGRPDAFDARPGQPPGARLSPEERRSLREAIRDAHRESKRPRP